MLPRSTRDSLLPLLLVGVLLLCHGAFGSLHQLPDVALFEHPAAEHTYSHHEGHRSTDGHPVGAHDYAAALFALLVGMVYTLLRREARGRHDVPELHRTRLLPTTGTLHLPRGPDPPLSQVLRL